jgi:hypothetical protein
MSPINDSPSALHHSAYLRFLVFDSVVTQRKKYSSLKNNEAQERKQYKIIEIAISL